MAVLQATQLDQQGIEVGVRDIWSVVDVVALVVVADQRPELVDPGLRVVHGPILPVARDALRAYACPDRASCSSTDRPVP